MQMEFAAAVLGLLTLVMAERDHNLPLAFMGAFLFILGTATVLSNAPSVGMEILRRSHK